MWLLNRCNAAQLVLGRRRRLSWARARGLFYVSRSCSAVPGRCGSDERVVAQPIPVCSPLTNTDKDVFCQPIVPAGTAFEGWIAAQVVLFVWHGLTALECPIAQALHRVRFASPQESAVVDQDQRAVLFLEHVASIEYGYIVRTEVGIVAA